MKKEIKRSYIREILDATNENTISFAGGLPASDLFPMDEIKDATLKALGNKESLQYSKSLGIDSLREKIAGFYTNKLNFKTSKDEILITSGSQQALDIVLKTIDKEDIIVENPSYIGALLSFQVLNKQLDCFSKIDELKTKLDNSNMLYLISDFQNPSTKSYSFNERKIIAEILNKNKSFLIEDGAYNFLDFSNEYKTPISKYCSKSVHLGSFSKIVSPGLRVGWIRADKELINKLIVIKEALDLHTSTLNQMILNEYLNANDLFLHIENINSIYKKKMNFMAACFDKYIPSFKYIKPLGGMFIYGKFEVDSMELAKNVLEKNIAFVPAEVFYINKKSNEARFNFTNCSYDQIEFGIKAIGKILDEKRDFSGSIW